MVRVEYDPEKISYENLLTVFFGTHDPTTLNRQGSDVGAQYRSVIFYTDKEQREEAEKFIKEINESHTDGKEVVTAVEPLEKFFPAEEYHKDYFARNPQNSYCQIVINPKLEKVQHKFAALLDQAEKAE